MRAGSWAGSIKKLLGNSSGYKFNAQKYFVFLYAEELSDKLNDVFTTASKRMKHPGINLNKEVKDLYIEN